jgi:hypothetical protein
MYIKHENITPVCMEMMAKKEGHRKIKNFIDTHIIE